MTNEYKNELDSLNNSTCSELHISGLSQKSFEYFVLNYACRFSVINFDSCRLINDFSCLETLNTLEYLMIEWNIRAAKLWNMSNNTALKGIYLWDTKKITNLCDIITAPNLKELAINESVDSALAPNNWKIESIAPLQNAPNLEKLFLAVSKITDDDISPLLKMPHLKKLHITTGLFKLEDYALLNARLKNTLITPDRPFYVSDNDENALVVGKGRSVKRNSPKLIEIQNKWDSIIAQNSID